MSTLGSYSPETIALHEMVVNSVIYVGLTVLVWDHILTFGDEVQFIWMASPGVVSVIFIANRYLVPAIVSITIFSNFFVSASHSSDFCKIWTIIESYLSILSFMSLHFIIALRVNAIYAGRARVKRLLWAAGVLYALSTIAIASVAQPEVNRGLNSRGQFCVEFIPSYLWTIWIPSVLLEILMFVLTVKSTHRLAEGSNFRSLYTVLFRDGVVYFVVVSFCSIFSLLIWSIGGPTLINLGRFPALCMANLVVSRLVLNLKLYAKATFSATEDDYTISQPPLFALGPIIYVTESHRKVDFSVDDQYDVFPPPTAYDPYKPPRAY